MGVPPNHPFVDGIFQHKSSIWGTPNLGSPHIVDHKKSHTTHIHLPAMAQAAPWVPDEEVSECPLCTQK